MIDYQLIRSARRKTLLLQVKQGKITVRAPARLPLCDINAFIHAKSEWLQQKLAAQSLVAEHGIAVKTASFLPNSQITYLDRNYLIHVEFAAKSAVYVNDNKITVVLSYRQQKNLLKDDDLAAQIKKSLANYFKQQLHKYIDEKLPKFISLCQLSPKSYKIRYYKSCWGSCNNRAELSFNYLLMQLPSWVIDYVIVHELCHLKHLNHSADFWQLVQRYFPNYIQAKNWLKKNQQQLIWT